MNNNIQVILVNENDEAVGTMEKMEAHQNPQLHRAFSVFILNEKGQMLLQQRAASKYHSPGLWTNACCGHPLPNEDTKEAATKRLTEEIGLTCTLQYAFQFIYKANVGNGLIEHELDHVFIGFSNDIPVLNPEEAAAIDYLTFDEIGNKIKEQPQCFTEWFKLIIAQVKEHMEQHKSV